MIDRRNIIAAIVIAPISMAMPAIAAPSFNAKEWVYRWAAMGGSVMLVSDRLSFAFRPEAHEIANPLFREFKAHPGAEELVKTFMRDHGLTRFHR